MEIIDGCFEEMYKVAKTRIINEELIGDVIQETVLSAYLKRCHGISEIFNVH